MRFFNSQNEYGLLAKLFHWVTFIVLIAQVPFPRIPYAEALDKYGTDKPDLRNPLEIKEYTSSH